MTSKYIYIIERVHRKSSKESQELYKQVNHEQTQAKLTVIKNNMMKTIRNIDI